MNNMNSLFAADRVIAILVRGVADNYEDDEEEDEKKHKHEGEDDDKEEEDQDEDQGEGYSLAWRTKRFFVDKRPVLN